jgi:hypothetical protein
MQHFAAVHCPVYHTHEPKCEKDQVLMIAYVRLRLAAVCRSAHIRAVTVGAQQDTAPLVTSNTVPASNTVRTLCASTHSKLQETRICPHTCSRPPMHHTHTDGYQAVERTSAGQAANCQSACDPHDAVRPANIRNNTGNALPAASVPTQPQTTTLAATKSSQLLLQYSSQPRTKFPCSYTH